MRWIPEGCSFNLQHSKPPSFHTKRNFQQHATLYQYNSSFFNLPLINSIYLTKHTNRVVPNLTSAAMDYDYRKTTPAPYTSSSHRHGSSSLYPTVGQPPSHAPPPLPSHHRHQTADPPPSSSGLGIRVAIKPEYRITPPPQLLSQVGDIPKSNFEFDFQLEKRIMAEVEKDPQNWSRVVSELFPTRPPLQSSPTPPGSGADPIVSKYIASGLRGEAVPLAVANYGDNPTKVKEFVNGYNLLREMGFSSTSVSEALVMYDNDTDKAIAHFLSGS